MDHFTYHDGTLYCEGLTAETLAQRFGTPVYVYSQKTLTDHYDRIAQAFAELNPTICYSIKCCWNVHLLRVLAQRGSGFDVVSGGELHRALQAGADPRKIVYAGVGKTETEQLEALRAGIGLFNIESESELQEFERLCRAGGFAPRAALRVTPDVDPKTHLYTTTGKKETKFGVDIERGRAIFHAHGQDAAVKLCGIHLHIGSPVNDPQSYVESIRRGLELIDGLRNDGFAIDTIDIGGGYGAFYKGDEAPPAADYAAQIVPLLRGRGLQVILEPGRSISANAGILLTRVLHVKESGARRFAVIDASMNELIRPALYGAYHFIWPAQAGAHSPASRKPEQPFSGLQLTDVVGPVCESGDFLAKERALPPLKRGDLVAIFSSGAYAMVMASQYNSRPRAPEVLVLGEDARLVRRRETYADLLTQELDL